MRSILQARRMSDPNERKRRRLSCRYSLIPEKENPVPGLL
jgi:hypothetical protein